MHFWASYFTLNYSYISIWNERINALMFLVLLLTVFSGGSHILVPTGVK